MEINQNSNCKESPLSTCINRCVSYGQHVCVGVNHNQGMPVQLINEDYSEHDRGRSQGIDGLKPYIFCAYEP